MSEVQEEVSLRIGRTEHVRFVTEVLAAAGAFATDAQMVAEALWWADLRGRHTNGLVRLENMASRLRKGLVRSPADLRWAELTAVAHRLDAGDALGHVASTLAIGRAVDIALRNGIGFVAVRRSSHYGAAAYYCDLAAARGCLSINGTNAFPKVAPHGGTHPALGTNPIAYGCPTGNGAPILGDMSTSAISGAEVRSRTGGGGALPAAVALDAGGIPTGDPAAAASGCLLPAAGPKGFALALLVEILSGLLSGAAVGKEVGSLFDDAGRPVNVGHFFLAIAIDTFVPRAEFEARLATLLAAIAATPRFDPDQPIRYPGEIRARYAEEYSRDGVPVASGMVRKLRDLAARYGVKELGGAGAR